MLLRLSLGRPDAADAVEAAVADSLDAGWRTGDIAAAGGPDERLHVVGTAAFAATVVDALAAGAAASVPA
jgi:3-isopropylmalate dehydrogenase